MRRSPMTIGLAAAVTLALCLAAAPAMAETPGGGQFRAEAEQIKAKYKARFEQLRAEMQAEMQALKVRAEAQRGQMKPKRAGAGKGKSEPGKTAAVQ